MGKDRRDTTLAFHVEDRELQQLYNLLAEISQLTASLGLPTGSTGGMGARTTAPPTPNYGAAASMFSNVSAPGGAPSASALGIANNPSFSLATNYSPANYSPAPVTPVTTSPQMSGGPISFNLSGPVTIHASGPITINGGAGGNGGGGTPNPLAPAPGMPPGSLFSPGGGGGPVLWPNLSPSGGGGGFGGLGSIGQTGVAGWIGHELAKAVQPQLQQNQIYAGLHITSPEDVAATRWRTQTGMTAGAIAGTLGFLAGGLGVGFAAYEFASTIGDSIGNDQAEQLQRRKTMRIATQQAAMGSGQSSEAIDNAFQSVTTSGLRVEDVERLAGKKLVPDWLRGFTNWNMAGKYGSGQFRDNYKSAMIDALGTTAPELLTNTSFLKNMLPDFRLAPEAFGPALGAYAGEIAQRPSLAPMYEDMLRTGNINRANVGELALLAAQRGDLAEARRLATLAHSAKGRYGSQLTGIFTRVQASRGMFETAEAGFSATQAEVGIFSALGRGRQAGSILAGGQYDADRMVAAAQDEVQQWQQRLAVSHTAGTRQEAQQGLSEAQRHLYQAQRTAKTLQGTAAELTFREQETVISSRSRSAQARLGTLQQTSFYNNPMETLYGELENGLKTRIGALTGLLKAYSKEGRGEEAIAPIRAEIEQTQQEIARMMIDRTKRAFEDSRVIPSTDIGVAQERLRGIRGTGQIYGPAMQSEFDRQTTGQRQIVDSYRRQYEYYRSQYGENSPLTQAARRNYETEQANQAVLPFDQIEQKYAGINSVVGNAGSILGSQANVALRTGQGSTGAFSYQMGQYSSTQTAITTAQSRLRDDTAAGAGIEILMRDRAAIQQAQEQSLGVRQSMADVVMPSRFNIEEMQAEGKLRRMQESWTEPGNMFDQYKTLYQHSQQRVNAIDQRERMLDQAGLLDDGMRERLAREREDAKQQSFQYREQMESGWIDRLVSRSISAPSFSARAKPTLSEAASELEYGQSKEEFRQAREFGFVSKRGYDYEKNRGFTTAGMNNTELFPGDIGMMAVMGKRGSKSTATQSDHDMPSADNLAGKMGLGDESDAATEDTQQMILQVLQRVARLLEQQRSGGMGSSGPSALGHLGVGQSNQTAALGAGRGDSRPPR